MTTPEVRVQRLVVKGGHVGRSNEVKVQKLNCATHREKKENRRITYPEKKSSTP